MDFAKIRNYLFLTLLAIATVLFLLLLKPFAYPIFWAAVIAAIVRPVYTRLNQTIKHANASAGLTLAFVVLIILIPLSILGTLLVKESITIYTSLTSNRSLLTDAAKHVAEAVQQNTLIKKLGIDDTELLNKAADSLQQVLSVTFGTITNFTQNSLVIIALFFIMLYSLFFFIRDGEKMLKKLMYLCPLGDKYEEVLYTKFTAAASATIKGTIVIGSIQGLIGGLAFVVAGIPQALIWGIVMVFFSVIPGVGSSIVWLPAALILLFTGHTWQGIMLLIIGLVVISTIDNLLRPILVGKDIKMPALLIFFSTLGGIAVFGLSGFLIGPVIASLFMSFWDMYEQYYRSELSQN